MQPTIPLVTCPGLMIDVADLEAGAAFWSALLGVEPGKPRSNGSYLTIGTLHGEMLLHLQKVTDRKVQKNRIHLDFRVDDVDTVARRIVELGGSRVSMPRAGGGITMADPDGNEFCIGAFSRDQTGKRDNA